MKQFILLIITIFIAIGCTKNSDSKADMATGATSMKTDHLKKKTVKKTKKAVKKEITKRTLKDFTLKTDDTKGTYIITAQKDKKEIYAGKFNGGVDLIAVTADGSHIFTFYSESAGMGTLVSIDLKTKKEIATNDVYDGKIALEKDDSLAFYKIGKSLNNKADGTPNTEIIKHLMKDGKITKTALTDKVYMQ